VLLEALFLSLFSASWLITLQDIAPIIGFTIIVIIVILILILLVKWYQYWVKKGFEEHEREHGTTR